LCGGWGVFWCFGGGAVGWGGSRVVVVLFWCGGRGGGGGGGAGGGGGGGGAGTHLFMFGCDAAPACRRWPAVVPTIPPSSSRPSLTVEPLAVWGWILQYHVGKEAVPIMETEGRGGMREHPLGRSRHPTPHQPRKSRRSAIDAMRVACARHLI